MVSDTAFCDVASVSLLAVIRGGVGRRDKRWGARRSPLCEPEWHDGDGGQVTGPSREVLLRKP